jgi:excisionase family DNA binding protein
MVAKNFQTVSPSEADARLARESTRILSASKLGTRKSIRMQFLDEGKTAESVDVPVSALRLFLRLLSEMSQGKSVTLFPSDAELTTQQAAEILNVSRPFMVKLLEGEKLPFRLVGKYRRVRLDDLLAYKQKDDAARAKILDRLTAEAQKLGMGY